MRRHILVLAAVLTSLWTICTQAAIEYEVIDLGTLGGNESIAYSINNTGQIVGSAACSEFNGHATLFDPTGDGNNIDLGTLGGIYISSSTATSINDVGQIVGYSRGFFRGGGAPPPADATLFDPNGTFNNIVLRALGGSSFAKSINNAGKIVGSAGGAVLFDPTGAGNNVELGTLGGRRSEAFSINDAGQIVGGAENDQDNYHATLFDPTGAGNNTDLSSLGDIMSEAYSINNLGDIVGTEDGRATMFDVTGAGNNIDLGIIGDYDFSMALSINDVRQIVGITYYEFDNIVHTRGTLFDPTGAGNNIDLNTLIDSNSGWTLERANDINNNGWIVGSGINPEGLSHAFLLVPISTKYSGGTGEPNDPYQIASAEDLMLLGENPEDYNKHFILTADIDLDPNLPGRKVFDTAVIAETNDDIWAGLQGMPFTGLFNGNGHTISHLTIKGETCLGLFGWLSSEAIVSDLGLEETEITGTFRRIGGLVGYNQKGTIVRSHTTGVISGGSHAGGLVGDNGGQLIQCYTIISVNGTQSVGGLVGYNSGGRISKSYSIGAVAASEGVGGLVGSNSGSITASYSEVAVSGVQHVGGLVGCNYIHYGGLSGTMQGTIATSYSTGAVSGEDFVGGLVGEGRTNVESGSGVSILHSVWDMDTSGLSGSDGGIGLSTSEMMGQYMLGLNGFANDPNWILDANQDYPKLSWENTSGDAIPDPDINWMEGHGTAEAPYLIDAVDQFVLLSKASILWDRHFTLDADIDLTPNLPNVPVFEQAPIQLFNGVFDGNGHAISNLAITGRNCLGLFGLMEASAEVRNLSAVDVNIAGLGDYVGGLVGYSEGTFANCSIGGTVSGGTYVGGLAGYLQGSITTSSNAGAIKGGYYCAGGLVGHLDGSIIASYNTGAVSGDSHVGGLVGAGGGSIVASYSTGPVSGNTSVGGLAGVFSRDTSAASFWDIETSGQSNSSGGTGLATAEMQDINTYLSAGWDFVDEVSNGTCDYWQISTGDYPRLRYHATSSPAMPDGLGSAGQPYLIRDARDLGTVWYEPSAHYRLEASVDLSGITWSTAVIPWFGGTFDGSGFVVSDLHVEGGGFLGMFGQINLGAKVKNIGVVDCSVNSSGATVAGLAGHNKGNISASYSTGSVSAGGSVGGLVGYNSGNITASCSAAGVSGIGGLFTRNIGGLVGINNGSIITAYCTGKVRGGWQVGGLVGHNRGSIVDAYSAGKVSGGSKEVYGLIGYGGGGNGTVTNCFWDTETSEKNISYGGIGKTTSEMQTASTFLDAGWDFIDETANGTDDIWWIDEGQDYPRLWWEMVAGN